MLSFVSLRQSRGALVIALNFFYIVLGLLFNMTMYLMMDFKIKNYGHLFEVILQASILVVRPMLASSPSHYCIVKLSREVGGRIIFVRVCSCCMSKWVI